MIISMISLIGAAVSASDWSGPTCKNPLYFGDIHSAHKMDECIDVRGEDGVGHVTNWGCMMGDDQQWVWCDDGTIRNKESSFCLTYEMDGDQITGEVYTHACQFDVNEKPHEVNLWIMQKKEMHDDPFGVSQMMFQMSSEAHSDWCLTWDDDDIAMAKCTGEWEQYWFFKSFGEQVGWGRLVNWQDTTQIMDVEEKDGKGDVYVWSSEADAMDQVWAYYENGQIVNQKSLWCLDVNGQDGGIEYQDVVTNPCRYEDDMRWVISRQNMNENDITYFPIINKKLEETDNPRCAMPWSGAYKSDVRVRTCEYLQYQYFYWDENIAWTEPIGDWAQVGCNMNGVIEQTITMSTEYTNEITESVSAEVSSTIKSGFVFAEAEVSTTIASETSMAFSSTVGKTQAIKTDCQFYDDGSPWQGGCLWQFVLDTAKDGDKLTWNSNIVRCSKDAAKPACAPFEYCVDEACTKCQGREDDVPKNLERPPWAAMVQSPLYPPTTPISLRSGPVKPLRKTYEDHRETTKCSSIKVKADCDVRGDCKSKMKKGVLGKCKALSCRRIEDPLDCLHANRKCRAQYKKGEFKTCLQERKHQD